jgi:hypothetical protein
VLLLLLLALAHRGAKALLHVATRMTGGWSTHKGARTRTLLLLVVLLLLLRLLLLLESDTSRPWVVEPSVLLLVWLLLQLLELRLLRAAHLMLTQHVAAAVPWHKPCTLGSPALVPHQTAIWTSQETSVTGGANRHHVGQVALRGNAVHACLEPCGVGVDEVLLAAHAHHQRLAFASKLVAASDERRQGYNRSEQDKRSSEHSRCKMACKRPC